MRMNKWSKPQGQIKVLTEYSILCLALLTQSSNVMVVYRNKNAYDQISEQYLCYKIKHQPLFLSLENFDKSYLSLKEFYELFFTITTYDNGWCTLTNKDNAYQH